jgi:hypothetical protein
MLCARPEAGVLENGFALVTLAGPVAFCVASILSLSQSPHSGNALGMQFSGVMIVDHAHGRASLLRRDPTVRSWRVSD